MDSIIISGGYIFILGLCIGSFLNELIDRLPQEKSIMGRSHCDYCKKVLSWTDLVPVFSFLFSKGRCRYCGKRLSWKYPAIEIATGLLFVSLFLVQPVSTLPLIARLFIGSVFLVIFMADVKYQIIPDEMQIALIGGAFLQKVVEGATVQEIGLSVVAGVTVMLPILFLYVITKTKGMGFGDVKLAVGIGFLMGIKAGLLSLYFGFILGAVAGVILLIAGKKRLKSRIAFGPFLVLGVVIVAFWHEPILNLLKGVYGL